ncbi:transcriptional regulator TbsP [Halococcus salifodinae]|uniref:transcriptional regulator TbsP n=1 Tax=Halococcus salifodinae TaxID=36738 RepID=UPI003F85247E
MESSSHVAPTVAEVYRTILADMSESSEVFVAGLVEETTAGLVEVLADLDEPPLVRLLAQESLVKWLRRDFHLASTAVDLVADEILSLRVTDHVFESGLVVGEESVTSIVMPDDRAAGLGTDDTEFVAAMRERCDEALETAGTIDLRTPPRSRVYETLADTFGSEVEDDFRAMLEAVESTRSGGYGNSDGDALDEVELTLLAAAIHGIQLYEISKWGEDVGVASKATFSRAKTQLEDQGVIATEKVPIDVGRPRLRLKIGDDRLRDVEAADLPITARELLASPPAETGG